MVSANISKPPYVIIIIGIIVIIGIGIMFIFFKRPLNKQIPSTSQGEKKPALLQVFSNISNDGTIDKNTALQAFAVVFGNMQDVTPPQGTTMKLFDATGPIRWVLAHQNELTDAQRQVVIQRLALNGSLQKPQAVLFNINIVPRAFANTSGLQVLQIAQAAEKTIEGKLGHPGLPWDIKTVDDPKPDEDTYIGYTNVVDEHDTTSGVPYKCHIYIANSQLSVSVAELTDTIDHEMFHCFQAAQYGSVDQYYKAPSWLIEGSAEWVGDELTNTSEPQWWKLYLTEPETSLFKRTYDAIGFYAHLKESGESPWVQFDSMYSAQQAHGNLAAFDTGLSSHADSFLETWATGFLRDPSIGPEWDTTGTGITADKMNPAQISITDTEPGGEQLQPVANSIYDIDLESEVAIFNTPTYTQLHDYHGNGFSMKEPFGAYCTKTGGCTCPEGSAHQGETLQTILGATPLALAVTGGRTGSQWSVQGQTLDDYCKSSLVDACLTGTWIEQAVEPPIDTRGLFTFPNPIGLTYTFTKDGTYTINFNSFPTITTKDGSTVNFSGVAAGKVIASKGIAKEVISTDFSNVYEHLTADGMTFPPLNAGALFAGFGFGGIQTTSHYICKGNSLTVTSADRTFTMTRQ